MMEGFNGDWSSIPTGLLKAELSRRDADVQPQCGSGKLGPYDTAIHFFALLLILALSTLACGFPLLSKQSSQGRKPSKIIFLCQHFGTGVLIATAFVHLLPTAFLSLTDPCLPYAFSKGYKPLAGLIAMVAVLVVVSVESWLTTRGAGHSHTHQMWEDEGDKTYTGKEMVAKKHASSSLSARRGVRPAHIALDDMERDSLVAGVFPPTQSTPMLKRNGDGDGASNGAAQRHDTDLDGFDPRDSADDLELQFEELDPNSHAQPSQVRIGDMSEDVMPNEDKQHRLLLQCLLLEAGILFHSVFIGMALSVATGPTFAVFLVAIAFHQSFEGLALGSRIAAIQFPRSSPRPWLMVLAYGLTTPLGQAIGLVVHNMYDPQSQTGLLMVGTMNAVSSGLLLFAGLVQLLAEDFLTEKSYDLLHGEKRVQAFLAVAAGAGLMAGVGALA